MSPLILVGLLAITSLTPSQADVKHVLEGSAHPPGCTLGDDQHHHHHHHDNAGASSTFGSSSFTTSGNYNGGAANGAGNNAVPGSVAFWWADSNSPFKHAYEYFKKCSLKGNCLPPVAPGFQLPNNLPQNGCTGNGCTVSGSFEYKTSTSGSGGSGFEPIDIKKNVFLNGQIQGGGAGGLGGCSGANCKTESKHVYFTSSTQGHGISGAGAGAGAGSGGGIGCSGPNCGAGSGEIFFHSQTQGANGQNQGAGCSGLACKDANGQFHTQSQTSFTTSGSTGGSGHINVAGNPFLNGGVTVSGSKGSSFGTTSGAGQIDINKNPFLGGSSQTQSAYSGTGQSVSTGSDGFLGVQPHVPFGKNNDKLQPFPSTHPGGAGGSSQFSAEYSFNTQSGSTGAQPFPSGHPGQDGQFKNCKEVGYLCVAKEQCLNGVVSNHAQALAQQKSSAHYCEIGKEVCCRLPEGAASHQTGSTSSYSSFTSGSTHQTSGFGASPQGGFANLSSHITAGKSSVPGSTFKFSGGAGLSPGSIQVLAVNDNAPNPLVSTAGESGQGLIHSSSPNSIKVARNTSPNPSAANSVFSSTVDYSNDKLDQLSFISTTQGPQYLPPVSSPRPPHTDVGDISPPISTYRPEIPTTSRPITKPVIPGVSVVTPFQPSSPKPFEPQEQHIVPTYTPKPTASNQYLPPHTSSPTPFVTSPSQPPSYTTPRPVPNFSTGSNVNNNYVPPKTTRFEYSPTTTTSKYVNPSTPGYKYPTPSPPFDYPRPSSTPPAPVVITGSGTKVSNQYAPPTTPKFEYPKPSPTFTTKQYVPPSAQTPGYNYPTGSPPFTYPTKPAVTFTQSSNVNNNYYSPPKQTYPTPTPPRVYPTPSPSSPPKVTFKPYNPPTGGYSYPTPTPSFPVPTRPQPPRANNEYLPPVDKEVPSGSGNVGNILRPPVPKPSGPPYIPPPPIDRTPGETIPGISTLAAGCAAALKCVEESYCSADGFISASPVQLTREQELVRVPTTTCFIKETGVSGKCCRDPNYVDPWPSANLINGEDDGQYREDDSMGQYFPQKQRPVRSGVGANGQNAISNGFGSGSTISNSFGKNTGFGGQSTVSGDFGKTSQGSGFGSGFNGQNTAAGSYNGQSTVSSGFGKTGGFGGQNTGSGSFNGQSTVSSGFGKTGGFGAQNTGSGSFNGQSTVSSGFGKTGGFGAQNTGSGSFNGQSTVSSGFGKTGGFGGQDSAGSFNGQSTSGGFGQTGGFTGQNSGSGFNGQSTVSGGFGKTSSFGSQSSFGSGFNGQGSTGGFEGQGGFAGGFGKTNGFNGQGAGGFDGSVSGGFGGQGSVTTSFGKTSSFQQFSTQGGLVGAASEGTCGVRNLNGEPRGQGPIDVAFAEIPWQAMVLRDSSRSLLCGGVIIKDNAVLTTARCIEGLATSDIFVKGGEWKLGVDEEPKPFQIVNVAAAVRHPGYQRGSFENDMALLMLEENLRFAANIGPICLPPPNQAPPAQQQCIATGWGKKILQAHLKGAIMRAVDVNILDGNQCSETLGNKFQNFLSQYTSKTICGYSNNDQCDVDYGSALACTSGNGQYSLAGIFSWDTGCKNDGQIGGYIQPDVEWIETTCSKPLSQLRTIDRQYRQK